MAEFAKVQTLHATSVELDRHVSDAEVRFVRQGFVEGRRLVYVALDCFLSILPSSIHRCRHTCGGRAAADEDCDLVHLLLVAHTSVVLVPTLRFCFVPVFYILYLLWVVDFTQISDNMTSYIFKDFADLIPVFFLYIV